MLMTLQENNNIHFIAALQKHLFFFYFTTLARVK